MNNQDFVAELAKLRTSSTFLTLKGYRSESSEIADYNIVFHMSYKNALIKSIATLEGIVPNDDLEAQAKEELITSFQTSLKNMETISVEELQDAYTHFTDSDGNYIKGVKLHKETNTLHIYGLVVNKKVIMPGTYKKTNRKPLTIAKDKLRSLCNVSKFRQFKITPNQVESVSVENISLLPPNNS